MYTYKEAANFAAFVLYAAKMNEQYYNNPTPPVDPRIEEDGWKVIAYISANDLSFSVTPRKIVWPDHVCYGYVAEKSNSPGEYVVAIRGTDPSIFLEDLHDGLIDFTSPWTRFPKVEVSQGFFSVYDSMKLITIEPESYHDYSNLKLAEAITRLIGVNCQFTIVGHSLGSAIASYLMYEIGSIAPNHSACLFACPRPGNREFSKYITQNFSNFAVFNYIDDIIPHLPPDILGYSSLDYTNEFKPQTKLDISDGPLCSHYLINYIARLDLDVFKRVTKYGDIDSCINL
ncbi:lipase family protein [Xenorhabdus japonica]|uniref:Lipase (Class 3) n=1 Tax=Xenorhabdus japonica TaxID=53341 RepID=A0A1I5BQS1_9GAMM|nr:lipase family protein [Xenorhabdus japonica]SFN77012.1 Lipase (class 3) [Xenorhabdus japonica]